MSQIKKDIKSLLKSSIVVKPLEVIKGLLIIKFLTPEMYGLLNIINQISSFAKYGDLGFISVVEREYNYEAQRDKDKAEYIKNVAYSAEFIIAIFLSVLIFIASFFYIENQIVFVGVISAAFMLLISKFIKIFNIHLRVNKEFDRFAKFNTLNGLLVSISIIASISYVGIYAPLIIGVISSAIVLIIMYKKINLNLTFLLEKTEILRQLRVGIVLGGLTLVYGLGIYLERFIIIDKFGLEGVGYFAFSMFFVMFFQYFIYDFIRPYMPVVREELSKGNFDVLRTSVSYPALKLTAFVVVVVLILQMLVPLIINTLFVQYVPAIELFKITILLLIPISLSAFSGYLLYSQGIEKTHYAYASHLIYIIGISLSLFLIDIESLTDIVKVFFMFSLLKNLFQTYHILNILYSKIILILSALFIVSGFSLVL